MPTITDDPEAAAARLRAGGLVAVPTETVYGLAADARNPSAIAAVYALKGRPVSNPLIVHVADADWLPDWAVEVPEAARDLIAAFWPGPLTLVLTARADVPGIVTADQDTVALRQPDHPLCLTLLRLFGRAVVAPSANRYMSISPTTAEHVARQFPDSDLLILDGGPCRVGVESTIVSLLTDEPPPPHQPRLLRPRLLRPGLLRPGLLRPGLLRPGLLRPRLLRPGMIGRSAIEQVLGVRVATDAHGAVRVPGQHDRHYAPGTPAWRFGSPDAAALRNPRLGWLLCGSALEAAGVVLDLGSDPGVYARRFYAALYRLDQAGLEGILVEMPPEDERWRAIRDRIRRATRPVST